MNDTDNFEQNYMSKPKKDLGGFENQTDWELWVRILIIAGLILLCILFG